MHLFISNQCNNRSHGKRNDHRQKIKQTKPFSLSGTLDDLSRMMQNRWVFITFTPNSYHLSYIVTMFQ